MRTNANPRYRSRHGCWSVPCFWSVLPDLYLGFAWWSLKGLQKGLTLFWNAKPRYRSREAMKIKGTDHHLYADLYPTFALVFLICTLVLLLGPGQSCKGGVQIISQKWTTDHWCPTKGGVQIRPLERHFFDYELVCKSLEPVGTCDLEVMQRVIRMIRSSWFAPRRLIIEVGHFGGRVLQMMQN